MVKGTFSSKCPNMKCAIILLSLVALGCAVPLFNKASIHIVVANDGTITIHHGTTGYTLVISRVLGHSGPRNVEIFMGDKHEMVRRIWLDHETSVEYVHAQYWEGLTEADFLIGIFRNYQGEVDVEAYTTLLKQVYVYCQSGHVSMSVYNILKCAIVQELSWEECVASGTDSVDHVASRWYSTPHTTYKNYWWNNQDQLAVLSGRYQKGVEGTKYDLDYVTGKPRYFAGQKWYLGQTVPKQYYDNDLYALTGHVEPAQYSSLYHQQGYMWQQPMYQKAHQMESYPHQLNYYQNYMSDPIVY